MKIVSNLKQGTKEWLAYRGTGLGASDAPAIMGVSPWTTAFELWCYKTKLLTPPEPNVYAAIAMKRGTDLEPKARRLYNEQTGYASEPTNVEHDKYPYIRASLDGISRDGKIILEIKTPGKEDIRRAQDGEVPEKYYWQLIQQLLLCPESTHLDYVTFNGVDTIYTTKVERNEKDEKKLLKALINFWELVDKKIPPPVSSEELNKFMKRVLDEHTKMSASLQALNTVLNLLKETK